MMLAMQMFQFTWSFIAGRDNCLADSLSRIPQLTDDSVSDEDENFIFYLNSPPVQPNHIVTVNNTDKEMQQIKNWLQGNDELPKPYQHVQESLSVQMVQNGFIILKGESMVIPEALRTRILDIAHDTLMGTSKMKYILRSCVYWLRLSSDIDDF